MKLSVLVGAEIYSVTGEALLRKCADAVAAQFGFWLRPPHFKVGRVEFDPRW